MFRRHKTPSLIDQSVNSDPPPKRTDADRIAALERDLLKLRRELDDHQWNRKAHTFKHVVFVGGHLDGKHERMVDLPDKVERVDPASMGQAFSQPVLHIYAKAGQHPDNPTATMYVHTKSLHGWGW